MTIGQARPFEHVSIERDRRHSIGMTPSAQKMLLLTCEEEAPGSFTMLRVKQDVSLGSGGMLGTVAVSASLSVGQTETTIANTVGHIWP